MRIVAIFVPCILGLLACEKRAPQAGPRNGHDAFAPQGDLAQTALATIDDVTITLGEFEERLNRQSPYIRARYTSLEQKKEFLENLIRFEILSKEAKRRGFDQDPEVVRTTKQAMIQKLISEEFDQKLPMGAVSDAEMRAFYDANQGEYIQPEEIRATAIILKNRAQAERVASVARGDAGKTNKGFRDLVMTYSQDEETKVRGGDLRYFPREHGELPKAVVQGAFDLVSTGEVSGVIAAEDGRFWVLKQTGRKKPMTKSFEDAKPQIRSKLFREKRVTLQDQFLKGLREKATIKIDETSLSKVRVDTSVGAAPADNDGHDHAR